MSKTRLWIVDHSALVRQVLTQIFDATPDIEVVGVAADPYVAREKIKQLNPDVLTLDVEMPRMDGVRFLGNLMRLRPMPVVMVSTLTKRGADVTLRALEFGAVDFVARPRLDVAKCQREYAEEIVYKVRIAACSRVRSIERRSLLARTGTEALQKPSADAVIEPASASARSPATDRITGVGSSTGGPRR